MRESANLLKLSLTERLRIVEDALTNAGFASILPVLPPFVAELPGSEATALAAVGLRAGKRTKENASRARIGYIKSFLDLIRQSDTPIQVAERLGLESSRIRQRIREGSLLAIKLNNETRVPQFQFEGNVEVPGLSKIAKAAGRKVTPLAFALWFTSPTRDLGDADAPISPRDWLLQTGDVVPVLALAESL
ncbi:MAG: hypothetical protein JSR27_04575 [Proteobacteria bacterium]|nr:hypothetical protein [Pseudomonadota bacterium]